MILGQLKIWARTTTYAALLILKPLYISWTIPQAEDTIYFVQIFSQITRPTKKTFKDCI